METTPSSGRLPSSVTPARYNITLTVTPEAATFSGLVRINVKLLDPARTVALRARGLAITISDRALFPRAIDFNRWTSDSVRYVMTLCYRLMARIAAARFASSLASVSRPVFV
jgi:hypothetical protein